MSAPKHALLSASSAARWLHCPPSARLTEGMPDTAGPSAAAGTLAHAVAELKLRKRFVRGVGPQKYRAAMKRFGEEHARLAAEHGEGAIGTWTEMERATDEYLEAVNEIAMAYPSLPYVALEQTVDFSPWVPDGFGTADALILGDGTLHVVDFKFGRGVAVEAEGNPQMRLYALGALERYRLIYGVNAVRMTIVQPRNGGVSHAEPMAVPALLAWAETYVKPRAALAAKGEGDFAPGEWCRFCKAKATCRARSDASLALEGFERRKPPLLTDAEVGEALRRAHDLKSWLTDIEDYALGTLLAGGDIPGWKAVEGRSVRAWTDQEAAFQAAKAAGIDEALLYKRVPVTLAALEKDIGKAAFAPLLPYVTTPPGKPTLAPESDRRKAITARPSAEEDFGGR